MTETETKTEPECTCRRSARCPRCMGLLDPPRDKYPDDNDPED